MRVEEIQSDLLFDVLKFFALKGLDEDEQEGQSFTTDDLLTLSKKALNLDRQREIGDILVSLNNEGYLYLRLNRDIFPISGAYMKKIVNEINLSTSGYAYFMEQMRYHFCYDIDGEKGKINENLFESKVKNKALRRDFNKWLDRHIR